MADGESPFVIVAVPDFSGSASYAFEVRSLFLLGSWMENAGGGAESSLHLACIGEPPASVLWLADRAGAALSTHEPFPMPGVKWSNKFRGFEINSPAEQILLVDMDVLILGDLSPLVEMCGCVAAAPEIHPRFPNWIFEKMYEHAGVPAPEERIPCRKTELGLAVSPFGSYDNRPEEARAMVPLFNAGILWAPRECGLAQLWEEYTRKLLGFGRGLGPPHDANAALNNDDEPSLSVAIEVLKARGVPFRRLPPEYHSMWLTVLYGDPRLSEAKLLHAFSFFRRVKPGGAAIGRELVRFKRHLRRRALPGWGRRLSRIGAWLHPSRPAVADYLELAAFLDMLHDKHVVPALKAAAGKR